MLRYLLAALLIVQFGCDPVEDDDAIPEAGAAGDGGVAGSGGIAGEAGTGGDAGAAGSGGTAGEAGSGGAAGAAGSGGTAGEAGTGGTAGEAGTGGTAGEAGTGGDAGAAGAGGMTDNPCENAGGICRDGQECEAGERRIRTACGEANQACCAPADTCMDADQDGICDEQDTYCNADGTEVTCRRIPPDCDANTVPEVRDNCFTDRCVAWIECGNDPGDRCNDNSDCNPGERCDAGGCLPIAGLPPCGGIAGLMCPDRGQICVDDPNDNCDPAAGASDCIGICVEPQDTSCTNNDDCQEGHWCRDIQNSQDRECVPFQNEGEPCGGFTPGWAERRCGADLQCAQSDPLIADAPGICRFSCANSDECPRSQYCAIDAICRPDGSCMQDDDCERSGNDYPRPLCLGSGSCNREAGGLVCGWTCNQEDNDDPRDRPDENPRQ